MLSAQFIQSAWIKRMPMTKAPSVVVNAALLVGFSLMTIYSVVFFVKDLIAMKHKDTEVDT